jgi:hypothetical protein
MESVPGQVGTLTLDSTLTTNTMIAFYWDALTGTAKGGSGVAITNYEIYWLQSSTWTYLDDTTTTTYSTSGLTSGVTYEFKV